jgi:flagellar motor switch protein FliG
VAAAARKSQHLTGPQKSAVLCIALGPQGAARILQQLSPAEVERVSREIAVMQTVDADVVDSVLEEFRSATQAPAQPRGGVDFARNVLEQAVGSGRAREVVHRIEERAVSGFGRLAATPPPALASLLRDEHPQVIALALVHLEEAHAAATLGALDPALAADVAYRVARMGPVQPDLLALVETQLGGRTAAAPPKDAPRPGGPELLGKWLNRGGEELEKRVLESITDRNADVADRVRASMFTFEDLLLIDAKGMQRVLREVETRDLATALKAASPELKRHILGNMSERAASALEEEIEILGPVRVKDVEAVHQKIVDSVRELGKSGEIMIAGRGGDDGIIQ